MTLDNAAGLCLRSPMPRASPSKNGGAALAANGVAARTPAAFEDAVVWAAWLYYADQLNQSEVAKALNVSRATVVTLLQEAREREIVTIRLRSDLVSRTGLAQSLAARYGLADALVIPDCNDADLVNRLGDAGARFLGEQLQPDDVIGVAWGRTVLAAARAMSRSNAVSPLTVVQVAGSSMASWDFSPELCTSLLANRLGARCSNLLAPALLSSAGLRDQLMAEPMLVHQFKLIRSANRILFGVGDLGPAGTLLTSGFATAATVKRYAAAGACGAVIGRFITANGDPVPGDLDHHMIGITLAELKAIPVRICVAGGAVKYQAICATLAGNYATHLVTDASTAQHLLKPPGALSMALSG